MTDWTSAAVDWRLFLPESWDDHKADDKSAAAEIVGKRARCAIPDDVRHREKWRLALDMIDELLDWVCHGARSWPTPLTATPPASVKD